MTTRRSALHDSLVQQRSADVDRSHARLFPFVEVEAQQVSRIQTPVVEISLDLLLSLFFVSLPMPDFELHDVASSEVVDDHIHTGAISGLLLDAVCTRPVDDGG